MTYCGQTVLHYCRIQESIALSSGEAELKATCRGLAEAFGIREVIQFLTGTECRLDHFTDSSAAFGVLKRRGAGAIKHLSVRQLWTQEVCRQPGVATHKIARVVNPADMLCSISSLESLNRHMRVLNFETREA